MNGAERFKTKIWVQIDSCEHTFLRTYHRTTHLAALRSLFTELKGRFASVGEEVALNVEQFGGIDQGGNTG